MTRPSVGQIDAGSVTSTPLYFGPDDASLFGVLSVPTVSYTHLTLPTTPYV